MTSIILLDGGMGQELMARSPNSPTQLWATQVMIEQPELVQAVHEDYFKAGADVATTNSYAIHRDRLSPFGVEEQFLPLHLAACDIANRARDAAGQTDSIIAGAMGPTGASYRPELTLEIDEAAEIYSEIARIQAPHVDLFLLETMSSLKQAEGAALGAKSANKPVWLSVTVDDENGKLLRSGENVSEVLTLAINTHVDALLINCSTPEAVDSALLALQQTPEKRPSNLQLGAYANGFTKITDSFKQDGATVDALQARQDLSPDAYLEFSKKWHACAANIIGGCCEVGPAHIAKLAEHYK